MEKMDWVDRMNSVLYYIDKNLDGEIQDKQIALLSANSKGMFQRIFASITNMTLSEYIRKRRLTQAALDIQNTDVKIIDIAVKYGYNSATAFSAAFKNFHGITPSDARVSGAQLQSFHRFTFKLTILIKGGSDMQYRTIENAENILQKMADKNHRWKGFQDVAERNGVKCACDGMRAAVILPEGRADWDLCDAYFYMDNENNSRFELTKVFAGRTDAAFKMTKQHAESLLDFSDGWKEKGVYIDTVSMRIIKENDRSKYDREKVIMFNSTFLQEALSFIVCSDDDYIEIYYSDNLSPFIMKSGRLYALVLPARQINAA